MTKFNKIPESDQTSHKKVGITRRGFLKNILKISAGIGLAATGVTGFPKELQASVSQMTLDEKKILDTLFLAKSSKIDWYPAPWSILQRQINKYRIRNDTSNEEPVIIKGFERMLPYLPMIKKKCDKHHVPLEVAFAALVESRWLPGVCSKKGACGYWQIMPHMAEFYGILKYDKNGDTIFDFRNDPEASTEVATYMMRANFESVKIWEKELYETMYLKNANPQQIIDFNEKNKYDSNLLREVKNNANIDNNDRWHFALYAYNGGTGLVKQFFMQLAGKSKNYYKCKLKDQNRLYVANIFAIRQIIQDHFGKNIQYDPQYLTHMSKQMRTLRNVIPKKRDFDTENWGPIIALNQLPPDLDGKQETGNKIKSSHAGMILNLKTEKHFLGKIFEKFWK